MMVRILVATSTSELFRVGYGGASFGLVDGDVSAIAAGGGAA